SDYDVVALDRWASTTESACVCDYVASGRVLAGSGAGRDHGPVQRRSGYGGRRVEVRSIGAVPSRTASHSGWDLGDGSEHGLDRAVGPRTEFGTQKRRAQSNRDRVPASAIASVPAGNASGEFSRDPDRQVRFRRRNRDAVRRGSHRDHFPGRRSALLRIPRYYRRWHYDDRCHR
ncbi:hypothetical protein BVRB_032350, partial [Beta vulgaris subsp. vulgaris]